MRMANYTDEKEKMFHDFVVSSTTTMQKISTCIDSAHEITTHHEKMLSMHNESIDKLIDRSDNQLELIKKLGSIVDGLNDMIQLVSKGAKSDAS